MEEIKKRLLLFMIIIFLVIFIIVSSFTYVIFFHDASVNKIEGITAFERKEMADSIANEINSTAVLYSIRAVGEINNFGESTKWRYCYGNYSSGNYTSGFIINIDIDNNTDIERFGKPISDNFINNYSINSSMAFEMAKENSEIEQWLNKYYRAELKTFVVTAGNESPTWSLLWEDPGREPHSAWIKINGNSGEVLFTDIG